MKSCPFKVGETVRYTPSSRTIGHLVMTDLAALKRGSKYKIVRIEDDAYVVAEGFESCVPSGVYWTEFTKDE